VRWKVAVSVIVIGLGLNGQDPMLGPGRDCGFSEFDARRIAHFVERSAVIKVTPDYPPAARDRGMGGLVCVRVLINKRGFVERTCPVFAQRGGKPDRSLVVAAEGAALHWMFEPNFGLEPVGNVRFDYAQGVIAFNFDPPGSDRGEIGDGEGCP